MQGVLGLLCGDPWPGGVGIKVFFIFVYTSATCDAQRQIHSVLSTYLPGGICEAIDKLPGGVCEAKIHFLLCFCFVCVCLLSGTVYTHRPSGYVMGAGLPWISLHILFCFIVICGDPWPGDRRRHLMHPVLGGDRTSACTRRTT